LLINKILIFKVLLFLYSKEDSAVLFIILFINYFSKKALKYYNSIIKIYSMERLDSIECKETSFKETVKINDILNVLCGNDGQMRI